MQEVVSYAALGKAQHAQLQADEAEQTNMALQERVETLRHQLAAAQADTEAYRSAAEEATNEQVCVELLAVTARTFGLTRCWGCCV